MFTFHAHPDKFTAHGIVLTGDEYRHATRAVRVAVGDIIAVTDGCGRRVEARITAIDTESLTAVETATLSGLGEPARPVTLALALIQPRRFEQAVEQCTEIGIRRFIPLIASRCEVRSERIRQDRLESIILSAVKQAGRSWLPEISDPMTVADVAAGIDGVSFLCAGDADHSLISAMQPLAPEAPVTVIVGPEGDFTGEERECFFGAGASPVSLGGLVLRSETAAVAAASACCTSTR
jgi:16S rRNA (uracil1498-N3)-methyltransferase